MTSNATLFARYARQQDLLAQQCGGRLSRIDADYPEIDQRALLARMEREAQQRKGAR